MSLEDALSELRNDVRAREIEIGNKVWAALDSAGLGHYARVAAGVDQPRLLSAPQVVAAKPRKPKVKSAPNPKKVSEAAITAVKKQIRMGGAKTAFVETLAEDGPQSASTVLPKTLDAMVEAGVVKISAKDMVSFTPLGIAWAATYKIEIQE